MIASQNKGRGFRGALNYLLQKERAEILEKNMAGRNERELAHEFGAVRKLHPDLERAVYHVSLSVRDHERLSDEQWREVAHKYLRGMGFENNQYILLRHHDTPTHDHAHILANRIAMDGKVVSDSRDYDRSAQVIKGLEREYHLTRDAHRPYEPVQERPLTKGQGRMLERTGEAPVKARLQEIIKEAVRDRPDMSRLLDRLEAAGVRTRCNVQSTGRVAGISYELDGVAVKGSQLGKSYAWDGLQKDFGVKYEQSRDLERCRQAAERGQPIEPSRPLEQARGISRDIGREHGPAERGNERSLERTPEHGRERDRGSERGREQLPESLARADHDRPRDPERTIDLEGPAGEVRERVREQNQAEPERTRDQTLAGDDAVRKLERSTERVADLAMVEPAAGRKTERLPGRDEGRDRGDEQKLHDHAQDRTLEVVKTQLRAYGHDRFDVGLRHEKTGRMMNRTLSLEGVEKHIPWLKRENALGNNIYLRPAELDREHAPVLILVDDLKREAIQQMKRDGFEPSLVLETSPGNYQAWVRVREKDAPPLSRDEANEAARSLARDYQGDLNSADGRHYGRLAGFTNQKEKYTREDGRKPFVKLIEAVQRVASKGAELLERVRDFLIDREKSRRLENIRTYPPARGFRHERTPAEDYRHHAQEILRDPPLKQDRTIDYSRVDYRLAGRLLEQGYDKEQTKQALREASPQLADRKAAHLEDYLDRTVNKAMEELTRKLSLARGLGRSLKR